ncbi:MULTISPECIES: hypothetical protein [Luteimonas]|uniref:hypothetical protein n=1 Tax=Luteimonas TaxID=83614 RepID=UPI000C7BFF9A|nr:MULTISPECIES: hypothetical protein [Luteimonas]
MTALTDALRSHYIASVATGRFDGDGLDKLLAEVEAAQHRCLPMARVECITASRADVAAAFEDATPEILKANADLPQPEHDTHVRAMEAREAAHRG